jgi:hypothetical protein
MKKHLICVAVIGFVLIAGLEAAGCKSKTPDYGTPNGYEILDASSVMRPYKTVSNGKSYQVTVPNGGAAGPQSYYVTHLWGSPYEMGYAQGQLYNGVVGTFINDVWLYMKSQVVDALPGTFPDWFKDLLATMSLEAALDWTEAMTRPYTGNHIYEELKGLSEGGNVDYKTLVRVHMIASVTQGKCSMIGAWGKAVATAGKLIQSRTLDWDMDGPFRDFSAITVYHPNKDGSNGHAFVNVGIMGFLGGLTGMSEAQLGISEIGVSYPDATFGNESREGVPFIFLLRDILQFDYTIDDAINRMVNSRRTCDLILGVGDGKLGIFRAFQYSHSYLRVQNDMNMMPNNATWHPRIQNMVYYGMDWICPSYNYVLSQQLQKYHGSFTPEIGIRYVTPVEKSGDNHAAYYDLTDQQLYVAFAAPRSSSGPLAAYDRQYVHYDIPTLLKEPKP